jgi:hypothetical protein
MHVVRMRTFALSAVALAFVTLAAGCSGEPGLLIDPRGATVKVGEPVALKAYYNAGGVGGCMRGDKDVTDAALWVANGKSVGPRATFDTPGFYRLSADYMGARDSASVTVQDGSADTSGGVNMSIDEPATADPATIERIFLSGNDAAVSNGGKPVSWTLTEKRRIREIWTYHWNDAKGSSGGGTIKLERADGSKVGSWKATRTATGQGGVPNAYWIVDLDIELPAGTYVISDSDPATWAQNALTSGFGHAWVYAEKK